MWKVADVSINVKISTAGSMVAEPYEATKAGKIGRPQSKNSGCFASSQSKGS
jgi:hypothetical protein